MELSVIALQTEWSLITLQIGVTSYFTPERSGLYLHSGTEWSLITLQKGCGLLVHPRMEWPLSTLQSGVAS